MPETATPAPLIRRLVPADASSFKELRLRGLTDHPDAFTSSVADWDKPLAVFVERIEQAHVIGAFMPEGRLVGHCLVANHVATGAKTKHKCELWSVYVAPEARGRGVARPMVAQAIETARALGFAWLKLQVAAHNEPAKRLYLSLGFEIYGEEEDYLRLPDGRSITELMMQRRL
ncbi:MAG: GNAT family N-acetyltransferase [Hyphomicrobiales bacterium]|uniref:GNAT family N-acetyltransferase n=1 Tax=Rhabdaerophilum calidifontis TaxID=2604328 RepID=UPI001FEA3567|nr:N-acetyltransferase [Rhabdaerophilum calidifontis]MCA1951626.1 GNAT family N-acetyltransferase [Hyphomicrobiales bacterium]MCA1998721.1 GNAT family N-acetyltransferase [Hyphomicrobiales bacterium]